MFECDKCEYASASADDYQRHVMAHAPAAQSVVKVREYIYSVFQVFTSKKVLSVKYFCS